MRHLHNLRCQRALYNEIRKALPWLDSSVWENGESAFREHSGETGTEYVRSAIMDNSFRGHFDSLKKESIHILRYDPVKGALDSFSSVFPEMAANKVLLSILHTDVAIGEIMSFAARNPELNIIIESGPRKILYFIAEIKKALKEYENVFLCTYNFCNWYGIEEICESGLCSKLLFGSHMPEYSSDAAMAPVIISRLEWKDKCDIAGNNLRRLLGMSPDKPTEVRYDAPDPYIIDSHAHNLQRRSVKPYKMPTPDLYFQPSDWVDFLDLCSVERMYLIPGELLDGIEDPARDYAGELMDFSPGRFYYYEIFNPSSVKKDRETLRVLLRDPGCIGIKIHPSFHKTDADDDSYAIVYRIAEEMRKPLMTHSWEISGYNPDQYRSHPDRFRRFLKDFRDVPFILGHAGGRPSAFEAAARVCDDFPNVYVDIAGDYYDNGLIDALAARIGPERILFGSDVDWIDSRCNLGPVLASRRADDDLLKILRTNALKVFADNRI